MRTQQCHAVADRSECVEKIISSHYICLWSRSAGLAHSLELVNLGPNAFSRARTGAFVVENFDSRVKVISEL